MRAGLRQFVSTVAILVIAFHTGLWAAVLPFAVASTVDPFTVICHSETSGIADPAPDRGVPAPTHACDHCNLCSAAAPPVPETTLAAHIGPVPAVKRLRQFNGAGHDDVAADPRLARGPPIFA